ncbi:MAG: folate-binding protein, partial [Pseudomonadota bacterium]|nr:folate-binding protein [Pseudomonadota bacterium]
MHDNPKPVHEPLIALPGCAVVDLVGADATRFAQAQFMNDIVALSPGCWHWNGWLTPKGRVITLFALLKREESDLRLLVLDADDNDLVRALRRFVFRSKVALCVRNDLQISGQFAAPQLARGNGLALLEDEEGTELDLGAEGGNRRVVIRARDLGAPAHAEQDPRWRAFDLEHGLPRLDPGQAEQWTPQQLSLERLKAFSIKKGCYPGQEIVARTHFLGKVKRGLALVESSAPIAPGASIEQGER